MRMSFDKQKFKHLVHYVIWRAGKRDWFGATKLNKVLWFADARQYVLTGQSITGATYIREKHGPVPKAIMPIREELERERVIRITQEGKQWRFIALQPADPAVFSKSELQSIEYWIKHIADDHTAESISELSPDYSWEIARMGEPLPFVACFAERMREPNKREMEWARGRAKELQLP